MASQFNLLDIFILCFVTLSVLTACWRGLGREMLHTIFFGGLLVASYFYVQAQEPPADKVEAARLVVNYVYIAATFYLFTWVLLRFVAPVFVKSGDPIAVRNRFWAGSLAVAKLVATGLALNLWYAVNTADAHPARLYGLPDGFRNSVIVNLSDATTEDLYVWLASHGWLDGQRYIERPLTDNEQQMLETQQGYGPR